MIKYVNLLDESLYSVCVYIYINIVLYTLCNKKNYISISEVGTKENEMIQNLQSICVNLFTKMAKIFISTPLITPLCEMTFLLFLSILHWRYNTVQNDQKKEEKRN